MKLDYFALVFGAVVVVAIVWQIAKGYTFTRAWAREHDRRRQPAMFWLSIAVQTGIAAFLLGAGFKVF